VVAASIWVDDDADDNADNDTDEEDAGCSMDSRLRPEAADNSCADGFDGIWVRYEPIRSDSFVNQTHGNATRSLTYTCRSPIGRPCDAADDVTVPWPLAPRTLA
jgi:hypothetical protein